MASSDGLVTLNVGGKLFRTTRATLAKHPDSMLAAMFRGDMLASALRDEQGHPFLDRDPTHFPFILAYLRDSRLPPLPQGLLELQQLRVEAEIFAMAELAEAAGAAAAATVARRQAAQAFEERRAAALRATEAAVAAAQLEYDAIKAALAPLRVAQLAEQAILYQQLSREVEQEGPAASKLRNALLARLCALGADVPAAEAQLRATHPQLQAEARQYSYMCR
ncbi:BTB POZ domain-containing KCTD21 [Chlorella sorokiniana]|uniref:BTB POZ domain-containing KCTD21 n=1 Tax=Chlorella sorokiniana TaxID=3076 RepID=A0A2P6TCW7_CHLSO|nr:BTB POZ domain-containing KCTD21 [Chlorella sorokiniana]|eukprot:PRW20478.1 BTB POZ domain-containing KCTD21 [Chlorella sorokiniana]